MQLPAKPTEQVLPLRYKALTARPVSVAIMVADGGSFDRFSAKQCEPKRL